MSINTELDFSVKTTIEEDEDELTGFDKFTGFNDSPPTPIIDFTLRDLSFTSDIKKIHITVIRKIDRIVENDLKGDGAQISIEFTPTFYKVNTIYQILNETIAVQCKKCVVKIRDNLVLTTGKYCNFPIIRISFKTIEDFHDEYQNFISQIREINTKYEGAFISKKMLQQLDLALNFIIEKMYEVMNYRYTFDNFDRFDEFVTSNSLSGLSTDCNQAGLTALFYTYQEHNELDTEWYNQADTFKEGIIQFPGAVLQLLREGDDPSQYDERGNSPFHYIIMWAKRVRNFQEAFQACVLIVKALLYYGCDPRMRYPGKYRDVNYTPIELAYGFDLPQIVDVLVERFNRLQKNIAPTLQIQDIYMMGERSTTIKTVVTFKDKPNDKPFRIISRLMPIKSYIEEMGSKFANNDHDPIYKIFAKRFKVSKHDKHTLQERYKSEFIVDPDTDPDTWVELISINALNTAVNEVHAFNSFQIVENNGKIIFKCDYTGIIPGSPIANIGIMPFFCMRSEYVLQQIFANKILINFFLALDYRSARLKIRELTTAKYSSPSMIRDNLALLYKEFKRTIQLRDSYIQEPDIVELKNQNEQMETKHTNDKQSIASNPSKSSDEENYNLFVLQLFKGDLSINRVAVISSIVGEESFRHFSTGLKNRLNLDLRLLCNHIQELAYRIYFRRKDFLASFEKEAQSPFLPLRKCLMSREAAHKSFWLDANKPPILSGISPQKGKSEILFSSKL